MEKRERYASGTPWEPLVGYSRAVRVGKQIFISGTTATDPQGNLVGVGDPYTQTVQTIKNLEAALKHFGATLENVVRTRMFVVHIRDWELIGKAHGEFFSEIRPATTLVQVSALILPEILIEIEADAIID